MKFGLVKAKSRRGVRFYVRAMAATSLLLVWLLTGCASETSPDVFLGYVEGELTYIASPKPGRLQRLEVRRGQAVKTGDPLFELEDVVEANDRREALEALNQARSNLADLEKGQRPSELRALEEKLAKAQAALRLADKEFRRRRALQETQAISVQSLDQARSAYLAARADVGQLKADLETAREGARPDRIKAARDLVEAKTAALKRADWALAQMKQAALDQGEVYDTFYTVGEWVEAGRPVVALLRPRNIKIRFFVPETEIARIKVGQVVHLSCDACPKNLTATVNYIRPQAEYTPPVIYSAEIRSKLVIMVEARPDPAALAALRLGLPVDVSLVAPGAAQ